MSEQMVHRILILPLCAAALLAGLRPAPVTAAPPTPTLESVLARVDKAAAGFRSMTAVVRQVYHTAVINDDTVDTGVMSVKRFKPREYKMLVELRQPDVKSIALDGQKAEIYYPKMQTVQEYNLGKNRGLVEEFLLLGFGSSADDLKSGYTIRLAGAENVAGQETAHLELVPTSKAVLQHLSKVDLWVSDATGNPVQQQFWFPGGGDYRMVTYTNVKINPNLQDSALKLRLSKGVKREMPQK